jgi:hypothetical protein
MIYMLEKACMKDEPLPETLDVIPPVLELATAGLAELLEVTYEDSTDATSPEATASHLLVSPPLDSAQRQSYQRHESSEYTPTRHVFLSLPASRNRPRSSSRR